MKEVRHERGTGHGVGPDAGHGGGNHGRIANRTSGRLRGGSGFQAPRRARGVRLHHRAIACRDGIGADASGRGAALRDGQGRRYGVVARPGLRQARCVDRPGLRRQPHAGFRQGHLAPGAGGLFGAGGRDALSAGRCRPRRAAPAHESGRDGIERQRAGIQPVQRRHRRPLPARPGRRQPPCAGGAGGAHRLSALRARRRPADAGRQYRDGGDHPCPARRADCSDAGDARCAERAARSDPRRGAHRPDRTGRGPGAAAVPAFTLDEFRLPADLPVLLPSELVRRRPDIQASEALLHAATADYGVAVAKLYPQLDLSASLGTQALTTGALFGAGSAVWSVMAQLTQPLFNPGLPAQKRASLAALDAAAANYQAVVLDALRNVADALRALDHDAQALAAWAAADKAAQASVESIRSQYALGAASYVQLLIASRQAQQTRTSLVAAQAQRLADSAALYQAMGGGAARSGEASSSGPASTRID